MPEADATVPAGAADGGLAAARAVTEPSWLRVSEATGSAFPQPMPGHLYFQNAPDLRGPIPVHQERVKIELEKFASVLRIVFMKDDPDRFREFFTRLLTLSQGAFSPSGFSDAPLSELPAFKNEIVQTAGSKIKAKYTARLFKAVLWGSALVMAIAAASETVVAYGAKAAGSGGVTPARVVDGEPPTPPSAEMEAPPPAGTQAAGDAAAREYTELWGRIRWDGNVSVLMTGLVLAASMWGLLFASITRSVDLTFETLQTPDADLIEPWVRLLFYGIAVFGIALVFQTGMVTITFGESFSTARIGRDAAAAVLVGLFLGVAERALPAELQHWAKKLLPSTGTGSA